MKVNIMEGMKNILIERDSKLVIIIASLAILLSVCFGVLHYKNQAEEFHQNQAFLLKGANNQPSWQVFSNLGFYLTKPVPALSFLSRGIENSTGKLVALDRLHAPAFVATETNVNYLSNFFGHFDLTFAVIYFLGLSAMFLGFNLPGSNSTTSLTALFLALTIPLVIFSFAGFLVAHVISKEHLFNLAEWRSFAFILLVFLLYVLFYLLLGAIGGAISKKSSLGLIALIFIFVFLNNVIPAISGGISEHIKPVFFAKTYIDQHAFRKDTINEANWRSYEYYNRFKRGDTVDKLTEWTENSEKKYQKRLYEYDLNKNVNNRKEIKIQNQLAKTMAIFSPAFSVQYIVTTLSGTGGYSADKFMDAATAYHPIFFNYLASRFEPESFRYEHPAPIIFSDIPLFEFKKADLYPPILEVLSPLLVLAGMCVVLLFVLSFKASSRSIQ